VGARASISRLTVRAPAVVFYGPVNGGSTSKKNGEVKFGEPGAEGAW